MCSISLYDACQLLDRAKKKSIVWGTHKFRISIFLPLKIFSRLVQVVALGECGAGEVPPLCRSTTVSQVSEMMSALRTSGAGDEVAAGRHARCLLGSAQSHVRRAACIASQCICCAVCSVCRSVSQNRQSSRLILLDSPPRDDDDESYRGLTD